MHRPRDRRAQRSLGGIVYPASAAAQKHGAAVEQETSKADEAYAAPGADPDPVRRRRPARRLRPGCPRTLTRPLPDGVNGVRRFDTSRPTFEPHERNASDGSPLRRPDLSGRWLGWTGGSGSGSCRQGVVLPETPLTAGMLAGLEQDVLDSPRQGRPLAAA